MNYDNLDLSEHSESLFDQLSVPGQIGSGTNLDNLEVAKKKKKKKKKSKTMAGTN